MRSSLSLSLSLSLFLPSLSAYTLPSCGSNWIEKMVLESVDVNTPTKGLENAAAASSRKGKGENKIELLKKALGREESFRVEISEAQEDETMIRLNTDSSSVIAPLSDKDSASAKSPASKMMRRRMMREAQKTAPFLVFSDASSPKREALSESKSKSAASLGDEQSVASSSSTRSSKSAGDDFEIENIALKSLVNEQREAIDSLVSQIKQLREAAKISVSEGGGAEKWKTRAKKLELAFLEETKNTETLQTELGIAKDRIALLTERLEHADRARQRDQREMKAIQKTLAEAANPASDADGATPECEGCAKWEHRAHYLEGEVNLLKDVKLLGLEGKAKQKDMAATITRLTKQLCDLQGASKAESNSSSAAAATRTRTKTRSTGTQTAAHETENKNENEKGASEQKKTIPPISVASKSSMTSLSPLREKEKKKKKKKGMKKRSKRRVGESVSEELKLDGKLCDKLCARLQRAEKLARIEYKERLKVELELVKSQREALMQAAQNYELAVA